MAITLPPVKTLTTEQQRSTPTVPAPASGMRGVITPQTTELYTFFTKATGDSVEVYTGDRDWANVTFMLETAGPVAISNKQDMGSILGGAGVLLQTNVPYTIAAGRGQKIYIKATSINRVSVKVEPVPWAEQIAGLLNSLSTR